MEQMIIVHWNKSTGPEVIIQYPPQKIPLPKELFLRIWAIHELEQDNSIIEFCPKQEGKKYFSIIQEFEGEIYFVILIYEQNQKFENIINKYPDILAIISRNLIELIHTDKLPRAISESYNTIANLDILEKEDILLNFFKDKIKSTILKILRKGITSKRDLNKLLKEEYGFSTFNLDLLLVPFLRENLIKKKKLPGIGDCYFMINDITFMRLPPIKFPKNMEIELKKNNFFIKYSERLTEIFLKDGFLNNVENKSIITYFIEKGVFNLIKTLRERTISVDKCINMLDNRTELFEELLEKMYIFEDKGIVFLLSDLRFVKFTPIYMFNRLRKRIEDNSISLDELLQYLKILSKEINNKSDLSYKII
ncbi:MAG: hypothetical protein ACP6IY_19060 [Promethearchaeia archaeon]